MNKVVSRTIFFNIYLQRKFHGGLMLILEIVWNITTMKIKEGMDVWWGI